ncbi:30S ribosomal protein S4 [Jimgerdemannia flammicorona]|uniref:U3 small nucleolar ribonucleoprotein protein IMP3 n=1 Tax=Jimgerdemannia flammicorona TaxID=994334 RepID=A0A433CYP8_9FUNG|nr:30S ribosomal protein S4 [Jimgerdemannia flammicorona]
MRQLKFHEQKLLKKVDFLQWKYDNVREIKVMRRYHIQKREDYIKYNKLCGQVKKLANRISLLNPRDPIRAQRETQLLDKLYGMGLVTSAKKFSDADKITVSAFCRRRLPIVMCRLKMAETVREAVTFVEQGHIRVGPETITDPAFLVNRNMEDFVTWVDTSKIRRKILKYNDKLQIFRRKMKLPWSHGVGFYVEGAQTSLPWKPIPKKNELAPSALGGCQRR